MLLRLMLLIVLLVPSIFVPAGANAAPAQKDETFTRFYEEFKDAVKNEDGEKVASLTAFDGFTWEGSKNLQEIKTRESFLKNYKNMFTPEIKAKIEKSEPEKIDDNSYSIIWHTKKLEFSLYFARQGDGDFKFFGLTVGPY